MQYFIEIPFGPGGSESSMGSGDTTVTANHLGDDLMAANGIGLLKISGRQFERITKVFQDRGYSYQVVGLGEGGKEESKGTVLCTVGSFPAGLIYTPPVPKQC